MGGRLDERAVERLNQAIRGARPQSYFHSDGSARFESEDLDGALGHLVALVVATRIGGLWSRLKVCANRDCRAVFYDFSNRRTTKWCTKSCNDLMKARTYRRRVKRESPRPGGEEIVQRIIASDRAEKDLKR